MGYWAKLEHGKKVRKPPLPKWPEDDDPNHGMMYYRGRIAQGQAAEVKPEVKDIRVSTLMEAERQCSCAALAARWEGGPSFRCSSG